MKKDIINESELINFEVHDTVAVLSARTSAFEFLTDLNKSHLLLDKFDQVEKMPNVKALLILNSPGNFGLDAYEEFVSSIIGEDLDSGKIIGVEEKRLIRAREINILNRLIIRGLKFNKLLVMGLQGDVVTPFFGSSLGTDFRFVSEDMSYNLAHVKYGLHPSGGLPFFLPRYVHQDELTEILFRREMISAKEAKEFGLVHDIYPSENFDERCIEETKKICEISENVLVLTKKFLNLNNDEILKYFHEESKFICR